MRRVVLASVGAVVLLACAGLAWFLHGKGLADGAAWANIASLFAAIIFGVAAVVVGLFGLLQAGPGRAGPSQSFTAVAGRNVFQAGGGLTVGTAPPAAPPAAPTTAEGDDQAPGRQVFKARAETGDVVQGGRDVDVDRS